MKEINILTKEHYLEMKFRGHLNKEGLTHLVDILTGKVVDLSEEINNTCKYKGLTTKDEDMKE